MVAENTLYNAVNTRDSRTENDMLAHGTTLNANLDLFFTIGAARGKDITKMYIRAFVENNSHALRILQWARDVREGSGERQLFRDLLLATLQSGAVEEARAVMHKIPMLGRWDDILIFVNTELWDEAVLMIHNALRKHDGLCAKWMPRKGATAAILRESLGMTPKSYRKALVALTNVVETPMCAKEWDSIDFGKLPSVASSRYQKAFGRNASEKYGKYIDALEKGNAKINAGAIYPHNIVQAVRSGNARVANEQWKALPDYMADADDERILPVVDVSGSMYTPVGGKGSIQCMDVSVALGLYLSERSPGVFKDTFITFSSHPKMIKVEGTLTQRVEQMENADWGMNTDLELVFRTILQKARDAHLSADQMPTKILILSDMQFDRCCRGRDETALDMISAEYAKYGYERADIIFWNLNARPGTNPVQKGEAGTALISGFSPSIMKSVLSVKNIEPMAIMLNTIMNSRYDLDGDSYEIEG